MVSKIQQNILPGSREKDAFTFEANEQFLNERIL